MKYLVLLSVVILISSPAIAQHGGFSGGGRGTVGGHGSAGGRNFGPGSSRSRFARGFNQRFRPGFNGNFYPYWYPLFGDDYDLGYPHDYEYPPTPPMPTEGTMPPPVIVRQAPTPPAHPVTHEYVASGPTAARGVELTFVIALRDGSPLAATAVWVQDGAVHYIDTEGRPHQIPLTSVDRNLTRKLNQEKNLDLRLPFE